MKIIYNNIIPFKGFSAINLFGVIFARKGTFISFRVKNHEAIHTAQMKELLYIGFYLWYIIEWLILLIKFRFNNSKAYNSISFEKEAYDKMYDPDYLKSRKSYSFINYLKPKNYA